MKTQLDEKQDLLRKIEHISSADDIQRVKIFIAGLEAGRGIFQKTQISDKAHEHDERKVGRMG